jgi:HSP20 family protein
MATFFDPFDTLLQFQQALNSSRTSGWLGTSPSAGGGYPPINIFRKGNDVVAIAEVPGISKPDLEIQVLGKTVRIGGRKAVGDGD